MTFSYKKITQHFNTRHAQELRTDKLIAMMSDSSFQPSQNPINWDDFLNTLNQGVCFERYTYSGNLLRTALFYNNSTAAMHIIHAGSNIHMIEKGLKASPLVSVASSKCHDVLDFLLSKNVDLNTKSFNGNTALHIAVDRHNEYAIERLILSGADRTIQDKDGRTAYNLACESEYPERRETFEKAVMQYDKMRKTLREQRKKETVHKSLSTQKTFKHKRLHLNGGRKIP